VDVRMKCVHSSVLVNTNDVQYAHVERLMAGRNEAVQRALKDLRLKKLLERLIKPYRRVKKVKES